MSNVVAVSLIIPYVTIIMTTRAQAQVQELPQWAVLGMVDKTGKAPATIGTVAADALRGELEKTGKYETILPESINRAYAGLNLVPPVSQKISLLRLGAELKATSIVTSDLLKYQFIKDGTGRRADVIITVRVLDVASGIVVNGANIGASSTVRPADTAEDTLLADALQTAAAKAILTITSKELPFATVLNTFQEVAYVNRGTRSGFKNGQDLIVLRGREQVATAIVTEVEPDTAKVKVLTSPNGVQPGDKVRVVFSEPEVIPVFTKNGDVHVRPAKKNGANSGFLTLVAVLGLVAVALLNGSGDQNAVSNVTTEATASLAGTAAVQIHWSPDMFAKGTDRRVQWWVYRSDIAATPSLITDGSTITVIDDATARTPAYINLDRFLNGQAGGTTCDVTFADLAYNTDTIIPGVTSGVPYTYQVALIYRVLGIELPNPDTTNDWCYFISGKKAAKGFATPYTSPTLSTPAPNDIISGPVTFGFPAVGNVLYPNVVVEYVVQVSSTATFTNRVNVAKFQRTDIASTISVGPIDLSGYYPASSELYWRVGVRNIADVPGPKQDVYSKERYVFSVPSRMARS